MKTQRYSEWLIKRRGSDTFQRKLEKRLGEKQNKWKDYAIPIS